MPSLCPKPCSRLATAAVFISVGVVQLLAGVILLRSKYAELLSGPNFLTASSNIGIGCVFGLTSSIWKENRKKQSKKLAARNNVLASLLISIIAANLTTATILIMGDGNKLLTLYMETNRKHISATFANEVLAGAYITSVCSPIVCLVVAIVSLSGNCFQAYSSRRQSLDSNALEFEGPFGWVYDPKLSVRPSLVSDHLETPSQSERSRMSEDSVFSENKPVSCRHKCERSIPSPLSTWTQKREQILRKTALMKRSQLFSSHLPNKDLGEGNRPNEEPSNMKRHQCCTECKPPSRNSKFPKKQKRKHSDSFITEMEFQDNIDYRNYRISNNCDESTIANGCNISPGVDRPQNCLEKGFRRRSPKPKFSDIKSCDANSETLSHNVVNPISSAALMKLKLETMEELKARMQNFFSRDEVPLDTKQNGMPTGILKQPEHGRDSPIYKPRNHSSTKDVSFSEDNFSDASEDLDNRYRRGPGKDFRSNSQEEKLQRQGLKNSMQQLYASASTSDRTSTYSSAVVEEKTREHIQSKAFAIPLVNTKSLGEPAQTEATVSQLQSNEESKKFKNLILDCPGVPSIKMQNRKRDMALRMSSMTSITESPSEEALNEASFYHAVKDFENSSVYSENSESTVTKDENSNITDSPCAKDFSLNRITSRKLSSNASIKKVLKRMWSSASPETKLNLSEMIVDNDSLIGLTEKELIARTLRIRALSKAVEKRERKEVEA